jgi:hypothetical protein
LISHAEAIRSMCGRGRVTQMLPGGGTEARRRRPAGWLRASAAASRFASASQVARARSPALLSK